MCGVCLEDCGRKNMAGGQFCKLGWITVTERMCVEWGNGSMEGESCVEWGWRTEARNTGEEWGWSTVTVG